MLRFYHSKDNPQFRARTSFTRHGLRFVYRRIPASTGIFQDGTASRGQPCRTPRMRRRRLSAGYSQENACRIQTIDETEVLANLETIDFELVFASDNLLPLCRYESAATLNLSAAQKEARRLGLPSSTMHQINRVRQMYAADKLISDGSKCFGSTHLFARTKDKACLYAHMRNKAALAQRYCSPHSLLTGRAPD